MYVKVLRGGFHAQKGSISVAYGVSVSNSELSSTWSGPVFIALSISLMGGYFIFLTSFYFSHNTDGLATCHGESGVFTTLLNIYSFSLRKIKIIEIRGLIMI